MYPCLAVVQALRKTRDSAAQQGQLPEILYVGGEGGVEEKLVARAGLPFVGIPAAGIHGVGLTQSLRNVVKLAHGCLIAYKLGRRRKPSVLFVTGGYASVPVAVACWALRVPILVYLPDIEPGLAVSFLARLASRVGVTVEESRRYFPARKVVVTGYPVRPEFMSVKRNQAMKILGLEPSKPVLLVLGGSRGARSINQAIMQDLEGILKFAQVVHVSGQLDWPRVSRWREKLPTALRPRYRAFPYLHENMGAALAASDLAVCRAGASTLGELPLFGLPAILVPYPYAWRYQRTNAGWLVERGGAQLLENDELSDKLLPTVMELLKDKESLTAMREKMMALARPDSAACLAEELLALA